MKHLGKYITSIALAVGRMLGLAGCSEEAALSKNKGITYEQLKSKVDLFDEVYAYYCYDNPQELRITNGEDFTPLGSPCSYTYITNIEGTNKADTVKSCTITVENEDGSSVIDEYFAVDASTLFIARTEIPAGTTLGDVTKYVYVDNALFQIDEKQSTMTEVEKADTLDLYFSFSDMTEKYDKK